MARTLQEALMSGDAEIQELGAANNPLQALARIASSIARTSKPASAVDELDMLLGAARSNIAKPIAVIAGGISPLAVREAVGREVFGEEPVSKRYSDQGFSYMETPISAFLLDAVGGAVRATDDATKAYGAVSNFLSDKDALKSLLINTAGGGARLANLLTNYISDSEDTPKAKQADKPAAPQKKQMKTINMGGMKSKLDSLINSDDFGSPANIDTLIKLINIDKDGSIKSYLKNNFVDIEELMGD